MTRLFCCCLVVWFVISSPAAELEKSVVQIITFSQQPIWDAPWRSDPVRKSTGSGFLIRGKRIMTNAHVVSWARQILIKRYQDPRQYAAKILFIAHDCDLELLAVEEPGVFSGMEPLELGGLPKVRSTVTTYGYPAGGEQISYTRGVVSRIELQNFAHIGNRSYLGVQTDAAINPGNSGGPVIQDDQVVGVAFQGMPGLENAGFFIAPTVIQHFLKDIEDGTYDGFPQAGIRLVPLENPAYRKSLKLPDNGIGARIDGLVAIPATEKMLRADDVLLQVGPYSVGSDGSIVFQGNRLFVAAAFQLAQNGESLDLKLWRDGAETKVALPVSTYKADVSAGNQYDVVPRYFVYGGLVFTPLSLDYMKTFGRNWSEPANAELIYDLFYRRHESSATVRPEPIVLASVLAAPVNANLHIQGRALIDKINGVRIEKLDDVIAAFASGKDTQHVIEFLPKGSFECLDRADADKTSADILKLYSLPSDRRL